MSSHPPTDTLPNVAPRPPPINAIKSFSYAGISSLVFGSCPGRTMIKNTDWFQHYVNQEDAIIIIRTRDGNAFHVKTVGQYRKWNQKHEVLNIDVYDKIFYHINSLKICATLIFSNYFITNYTNQRKRYFQPQYLFSNKIIFKNFYHTCSLSHN